MIQQRAPAQPVNEPQTDKSEDQIGHANADGLEQRGFLAQTGHLKNARRKIENGIDAGELVEERDEKGEQDRARAAAKSKNVRRWPCSEEAAMNLIRLGFDFRRRGVRVQ